MLVLATGGTVDKLPVLLPDGTFDHASKEFEKRGESHVPEMMKLAHFLGEYAFVDPFMIDSLEMRLGHRKMIGTILDGSEHTQAVITHGTDSMAETSQFLNTLPFLAAKTIVLTGAMEPFSMGGKDAEDAVANLRLALATAQDHPAGVYVAMGGQVFDADNVRKDHEARMFKTLHD